MHGQYLLCSLAMIYRSSHPSIHPSILSHLLVTFVRHACAPPPKVWDNDGEFLLIEAAYAIPRWLKPDTATNRVWLRGGEVHIIPQPSGAAPNLPPFPTTEQAIQVGGRGKQRAWRFVLLACSNPWSTALAAKGVTLLSCVPNAQRCHTRCLSH
jgi:hypothetical protein